MERVEKLFCYFSVFYFLNYLWIERYVPFFSKIELVNVITIFFLIAIIINIPYLLSQKIEKFDLVGTALLMTVLLSGFLSWFLYRYQSLKPTLTDFFLFSRFIIIFIAISSLMSDDKKKELKNFFVLNLKYLVIINFLFLLLNIPLHLFPTMDIRLGYASQQLIYSHPTYLATVSFLGWSLIEGKGKRIFQIMAVVLMISTMRTKIILLVTIYVLYNVIIKKVNIPVIKSMISGSSVLILGYIVFGDLIYNKLINQESSVRAKIMLKSFEIAKDHFPFGTGFATFGSYSSFINYSPIYNIYGLSQSYGFLETSYQYGMDSYISMLVAQFGFIGAISFLLMLLIVILRTILSVSSDKKSQIELIGLFLVISCFTESIINTGLGVAIFFFLALSNSKTEFNNKIFSNN